VKPAGLSPEFQHQARLVMKFSVNTLIQILALSGQVLNSTQDLVPPEHKVWVSVALSIMQGTAAMLAHYANPDGTPATEPYVKKQDRGRRPQPEPGA
jgi:hypothetical protein